MAIRTIRGADEMPGKACSAIHVAVRKENTIFNLADLIHDSKGLEIVVARTAVSGLDERHDVSVEMSFEVYGCRSMVLKVVRCR